METTSVRCNSCGAALDVGAQTRFVTCRFCQSQLEVKRTETSSFTEIVQRIEVNTDKLATQIKVLELQNELERLELNWERRKQSYYVRNRDGSLSPPSRAGIVIMGIFGVGFMTVWVALSVTKGAPCFVPLFGLGMLAYVVFYTSSALNASNGLEKAEARFKSERSALFRMLEAERKKVS